MLENIARRNNFAVGNYVQVLCQNNALYPKIDITAPRFKDVMSHYFIGHREQDKCTSTKTKVRALIPNIIYKVCTNAFAILETYFL